MTGAEFLAYVKRKFKRTDKDTEIYQATTDIIADIRLRILAEDYKEEAHTVGITSLGDFKIALPSDFGHIIGSVTVTDPATDEDFLPLNKISKQEYDELYGTRLTTNPDTGVPRDFCVYGKQLYIGPVPDKITYKYNINYSTEAYTEVTAATDPVPFSDRFRNVLRAGVLKEMHNGLENYAEAAYWEKEYEAGGERIAKNDADNVSDHSSIRYNGI